MSIFFLILQILVSVLLIGLILLQSSKGGLGGSFGGSQTYRTKRGAESIVFYATIIVAVLFLVTSLLSVAL